MDTHTAQIDDKDLRYMTRRAVYLTAVLSTIFGILYFLGMAGKLIVNGTIHSPSSPGVQVISAGIGLLWDITLVIMFAALRRQSTLINAFLAELGFIFMALLGATSSINWFVQLTLVPRVAQSAEATLMPLIDIYTDTSIMYAIEHLGWGVFYGFATIFMGLSIGDGRIETWVRWLFIVGGVLSLLHVIGIMISSAPIGDLGNFAAGVLLPITTTLLAIRFRKD